MSDAEASTRAQIATLRAQRNQALDAVVELQGALAELQELIKETQNGDGERVRTERN